MCRRRIADQSGQSTVEWVGLVLVVALLLAGFGALVGVGLPGVTLARAVAAKLVCAAGLGSCEAEGSKLASAYGADVAALISEHAPRLVYERGMRALPVDYRRCREDPCSLGEESGEVSASLSGEPVTLFTHAVDCRPEPPPPDPGHDCSGERAGRLYVQFWAYYPGSDTRIYGDSGWHRDDWESFQLRLSPEGAEARASSHQGYNYGGGIGNWLSDAGITHRPAWGPEQGGYYVSGGSHAGHASDDETPTRWTSPVSIRLLPLEPIAASHPNTAFAITAPWLKRVWSDPEYEGTD